MEAVARDWTTRHAKTWKRWLAEFTGKPRVHIIEVGCFAGLTTEWFCKQILTGRDCRLDAIDTWQGPAAAVEADFDARIAGRPVTKHKDRSSSVLPRLVTEGRRYNAAYVDGCHYAETVLLDLVLCWLMLCRGGVLIADDYTWTHRACPMPPKLAIDAFLAVHVRSIGGYEFSPSGQFAAWKRA